VLTVRGGRWTRRFGGWCPELRRQLRALAARGLHVVHNHGLWLFPNLYARQTACERNLPLVLSPRGMLEDWSLRRSCAKKWLVWHLMEERNLLTAAAFHATSPMEADSIRRLGFGQPIAVIPNGVDMPVAPSPGREVLERRFPSCAARSGCYSCHGCTPKGLLELAGVWAGSLRGFPIGDWSSPGRTRAGFQSKLQAGLVASGGDRAAVFTGGLQGEDNRRPLRMQPCLFCPRSRKTLVS
jgi:glycosyltransferase involved in cell wall biosynthesis